MHGYHDLHPSLIRTSTTASPASLAALFDVDNTLIPGEACEVRFFRYLWRRRLVGWRELRRSVLCLIRQGLARVDTEAETWQSYAGLNGPYTYSDMTGWGLNLASGGIPQG